MRSLLTALLILLLTPIVWAGAQKANVAPATAGKKSVNTNKLPAQPKNGIVVDSPADARTLGLDSLREAVRRDGGVPLPTDIDQYVVNRKAAVQLGKALFWDMQVGSDGIQACASCHFHAGADVRPRNQANPNFTSVVNERVDDVTGYFNASRQSDTNFETVQPNQRVRAHHFPLVRTIQELEYAADGTVRAAGDNSNDVVSSMGMHQSLYNGVQPGKPKDLGTPLLDPVWNINGEKSVRRVEPRNAPSVINAVFNYTNFWDGRASPHFNGQSSFGDQDPTAIIAINDPATGLTPLQISLDNASLASQAVTPPTNTFEMSFGDSSQAEFRSFADIGVKLLRRAVKTGKAIRPLGKQRVHRHDSVLGKLSRAPKRGLSTSYAKLIQEAFAAHLWNSPDLIPISDTVAYAQMEFNFSLFFGLSVALYESTLVSDRSPFDRWMETGRFNRGFGERELTGLELFVDENKGNCLTCHSGPEFTQASVRNAKGKRNLIGAMAMPEGASLYDVGFYNIAVTPTTDDIGRGAQDPFGSPVAYTRQAMFERLQVTPPSFFQIFGNQFIPAVNEDTGEKVCEDLNDSGFCEPDEAIAYKYHRVAVDGAFKTPGLRNIELTGPYFHNGGVATLRQVVQFYNRGGNFCRFNKSDLHTAIKPLALSPTEERQLVAFMLSLTDKRVKYRRAPFDHPELRLPVDGRAGMPLARIRQVGARGARAPLKPFLKLNPMDALFTPDGNCASDGNKAVKK